MSQKNFSGKPFSNMELSSFCEQMHLILKSGISSIEGLTIMQEDTPSPEEKAILESLLSNMQESGFLYLAMQETHLFPEYMLHMIQIGEETGTLDEVMEALKLHYDREDSIQKTIRNAVTYPAIMTAMMAVVIVVLLVKVMPIFNQVFVQLGTEMTGFSRVLMNIGTVIHRYSVFFVAVLFLILILILYGTRTSSGRSLVRKIGYGIPFTKMIFEKKAACRFASGMALTLKSGLNPDRSMELVCSLNEDPYFQKKLDACQEEIANGADFSQALLSSGIFTGMYARMTSIGSKTGSMEQVMEQIASSYQDEIDTKMNNMLSVLEPTLVVLLSLIVGVILLSVMLPLMGIMSSI